MQAGVREVLPNFTHREIRQAAARACSTLATAGEILADLYAFMPAKPGCGGTTLATYATAMAAELNAEPTLLLDFDIRLGVTSFLLKAEGAHTIVDALLQSDRLDLDIWSSLVSQIKNLHLLGSGPMDFSQRVPSERFMQLLDFALRRYSLVAVDLPGTMEDQECETLLRSKRIYLVCTPDIGALHVARRKAIWLRDLRLTDKVSVVLNCVERRNTLSVDDIQRIIQLPIRHLLPASAAEIYTRGSERSGDRYWLRARQTHLPHRCRDGSFTSLHQETQRGAPLRRVLLRSARRGTCRVESNSRETVSSFSHENDMTNQTILTLLNYLCNEARNSVQASFGLMALAPALAPDPAWQTCLDHSKCGADRLLRCIDDIRELLATETPLLDPAEEFDVTLCLGETIEVLNLASGDSASRLILKSAARPVIGRQHRRAVEQTLMRILDAVSKLGRKGEALVTADAGHRRPSSPVRDHTRQLQHRIACGRLAEQRCGPRKLSGCRRGAVRRRHIGGREAHSCARGQRGIRERRARAHGLGGLTPLAGRNRPGQPSRTVPPGTDRPERSGGRGLR